MNMNNSIILDAVSKTIGKFRLESISFTADPKSIIGIIGENGAGKTTLLRIISHTLTLDSGNISIPSKKDIGFQFDSNHFPEELSAKNLNAFMPYIFDNWDSDVFVEYLNRFEIPKKQSIRNYSKGMKMKMGIAVTLSHHAKLLLLDEITSGLDPLIRDTVLLIIKEYVETNSCVAIMTTHLLEDVIKIANNVILLHKGASLLNRNVSDIDSAQDLENEMKKIIAER